MSNESSQAGKPEPPESGGAGGRHAILQPYSVECGDDKARTICLDHMRMHLRGRWSRNMFPGRSMGPLNHMPDIPGLYLNINPRKRKLVITDPLNEDGKLLEEINRAASNTEGGFILKSVFSKFKGVETTSHDLDDDQLLSIMVEVATKVYGPSPCMRPVPGSRAPTLEEIAAAQKSGTLAGLELYDPWSNSQDKPRYKRDAQSARDAWARLGILSAIAGAT
jgi:hypothetical protein